MKDENTKGLEELSAVVDHLRALGAVRESEARSAGGPELDVKLLTARIRAGLGASHGLPGSGSTLDGLARTSNSGTISLPRPPRSPDPIANRASYSLGELLAYDDEDFVGNAYRALLKREPDPAGMAGCLDALHARQTTKVELVASLLASSEGRHWNIKVVGMARPLFVRRMRRVPILGLVVGMLEFLLKMPFLVADVEYQDVLAKKNARTQRSTIEALAASSESAMNSLAHRASASVEMNAELARRVAKLNSDFSQAHRATVKDLVLLAEKALVAVSSLRQELADIDDRKADSKAMGDRLDVVQAELGKKASVNDLLLHAEKALGEMAALQAELVKKANANDVSNRLSTLFPTAQIEAATRATNQRLDGFYAAFEDRFRGARDDIKGRVSVYLSVMKEAGAGTREHPILDVGCGRGEWLELLRESGLVAGGLDNNPAMVEQCRAGGFDVAEGDLIEHLRGLEANSLGAITGMHIIEHVSFPRLIALFDEAFRVLRPGGVAIFETPNPENLIVGSCNFWYDPTHARPLPPLATQFMAQSSGFVNVDIMRLHPYPVESQLVGGETRMRETLNGFLYGPQDYAVRGYKPAS